MNTHLIFQSYSHKIMLNISRCINHRQNYVSESASIKISEITNENKHLRMDVPMSRVGFIYFIQEEELRRIKIGFTTSHPYSRLKQLANASSQALSFVGFQLGDEKTEKALHQMFKHLLRRNEWFDAGKDLLDYIDGLSYGSEFEKELRKFIPAPGDIRSLGASEQVRK